MSKFWKYTLINIGIIYGITLLPSLTFGLESSFLIIPIILSVIEFAIALLFLIPEETRKIGQAMIAATGIVFLIGLSVCSYV